MNPKYFIKYLIQHFSNGYSKSDSKPVANLITLEKSIIEKSDATAEKNILRNTLSENALNQIEACIDYFKTNPNENYPDDIEYNEYLISNNLHTKNILSKDTLEQSVTQKLPRSTSNLDSSVSDLNIAELPENNFDNHAKTENINKEQQPFKQELSRQDLVQLAKVAELVLTLSNDVNKLTKYNENYHQKISYKFSELEDRINNVENVEKHIVAVHESMNGLQTILPTSTIEIINNLKSAKSEFKTLSNTISGEISILNNELVKRVQDFNISIIDELSKVQRKNKEMADTIAIEVMNEAAKHIKHVNDEYINKAVQKNRNILIYGLAGSLIFSIVTGAFVGKIVGNQAATATTEYIQSKFDAAAQQHQQEQLDQLKSQANKRKRQG